MPPIHSSKIDPLRYFKEVLSQGFRPDGRGLREWRPVSVNVKSFHNADGSAIVKIGNTTVVCGIKLELAKPKAEAPDQGYLIPNIDLPPLCSGQYQPGPPCDYAQEATKFVNEILQNSNCINLKDLCIVRDQLCWVVYLDVICLNQDGSLLDGCIAACIAALKVATIPEVIYNLDNGEKIVDITKRKSLKLNNFPVSTSFAVFDSRDTILYDPTAEEESLSAGTITVVIQAETGDICGIYQPGTVPINFSDLAFCESEARKRTKAVAELINTAVANDG